MSTTESIRTQIANLNGQLAALAGEPLVLHDEHHGRRADAPAGGALLKHKASEGQFYRVEWYPTVEAARAALLKLAGEYSTVPDEDGWGFDLAPELDVQAWIERRPRKS